MNAAAAAESLDHSGLKDIYRTMVRIAEADAAIQRGLSAGEIQFQYYPCGGPTTTCARRIAAFTTSSRKARR